MAYGPDYADYEISWRFKLEYGLKMSWRSTPLTERGKVVSEVEGMLPALRARYDCVSWRVMEGGADHYLDIQMDDADGWTPSMIKSVKGDAATLAAATSWGGNR